MLRRLFRDHRRFAALLIALALAMKALVPGGYMVGQQSGVFTVEICADTMGVKVTRQIVIPRHGGAGEASSAAETGKACPYAGLGGLALPGADPLLLAAALAFVLALGFAPVRSAPPRRIFQFRPPLRGPPAFA